MLPPTLRTEKAPTKSLPELVGGLALAAPALKARADAARLEGTIALIANAEYWLGFELSKFEPLVQSLPSPLRELAVGVLLRYGDDVEGRLTGPELDLAERELLTDLPDDVRAALLGGLGSLRRAVLARDAIETLRSNGFGPHEPKTALGVAALMTTGSAEVALDGARIAKQAEVPVGTVVVLSSKDERGRPTDRPEVDADHPGAVYAKTLAEAGARAFVFLIPGRYRARVPGRSVGAIALLAR